MATSEIAALRGTPRPLSGLARLARLTYALFAGLLVVCVVLQVMFAGLGVLVDPSFFGLHRAFGAAIGLVMLPLVVAGLLSRHPRQLLGLTGLLLLLYVLQYVFLYLPLALGMPGLRALHAVNALSLFSLSVQVGRTAWRSLRAQEV
ncbi:MAG TPA: DUF6220 domain-containing protein [Chloroflexota bacterium]|nr:DUF6220 domain-containing protein [Chloroflexota bacterium]